MAVFRLDEILRGSGLYTRREAIRLVNEGRVTVEGRPAAAISQRCDSDWDIRVDGAPVRMEPFLCLMLNKPAGYVTATVPGREPPVTDLLEPQYRHLFPVGRLDLDAEGLLLLTNDGALCHRIIMPDSAIQKEYYIEVSGRFLPDTRERFRAGIPVDNGLVCRPADIEIAPDGRSAHVWVTEGKRHQVKRMAAAAGARVRYLKRLAIGGLRLDAALTPGEYRALTEEELGLIFQKNSR